MWQRASSTLGASARKLGSNRSIARAGAPTAQELLKAALVSSVNPRLQLLKRPVLLSCIVGLVCLASLALIAALQFMLSCHDGCLVVTLPRLRGLSAKYTCSSLELSNWIMAENVASDASIGKDAYRLVTLVALSPCQTNCQPVQLRSPWKRADAAPPRGGPDT